MHVQRTIVVYPWYGIVQNNVLSTIPVHSVRACVMCVCVCVCVMCVCVCVCVCACACVRVQCSMYLHFVIESLFTLGTAVSCENRGEALLEETIIVL